MKSSPISLAKAKGQGQKRTSSPSGSGTPRRGPRTSSSLDLPIPMTGSIDPRRVEPEEKLTAKQLLFTELIFHGYTPWKAYQKAYGFNPSSRHADRSLLVRRTMWSSKVRNRMAQLAREEVLKDFDNAYNRRLYVLQGLTELAGDTSISPLARLKALELLGKVRGTDLFTDRVETISQGLTDEQVKEALSRKLAELGIPQVLPDQLVIEHKEGEET